MTFTKHTCYWTIFIIYCVQKTNILDCVE